MSWRWLFCWSSFTGLIRLSEGSRIIGKGRHGRGIKFEIGTRQRDLNGLWRWALRAADEAGRGAGLVFDAQRIGNLDYWPKLVCLTPVVRENGR